MNRAVVYYSLSGNTKEAAKVIARKLGAKIFEIDLVKPLPKNTVRQCLSEECSQHLEGDLR